MPAALLMCVCATIESAFAFGCDRTAVSPALRAGEVWGRQNRTRAVPCGYLLARADTLNTRTHASTRTTRARRNCRAGLYVVRSHFFANFTLESKNLFFRPKLAKTICSFVAHAQCLRLTFIFSNAAAAKEPSLQAMQAARVAPPPITPRPPSSSHRRRDNTPRAPHHRKRAATFHFSGAAGGVCVVATTVIATRGVKNKKQQRQVSASSSMPSSAAANTDDAGGEDEAAAAPSSSSGGGGDGNAAERASDKTSLRLQSSGVINLAVGHPAPSMLPNEVMARAMERSAAKLRASSSSSSSGGGGGGGGGGGVSGVVPLNYVSRRGSPETLDIIAGFLTGAYSGIGSSPSSSSSAAVTAPAASAVAPESLVITNGVSHGIDMACAALTRPGDVVVQSDPFKCGGAISHINDWMVLVPIFYEDELIGFSSMFGHMMDVGGPTPGSAGGVDLVHHVAAHVTPRQRRVRRWRRSQRYPRGHAAAQPPTA